MNKKNQPQLNRDYLQESVDEGDNTTAVGSAGSSSADFCVESRIEGGAFQIARKLFISELWSEKPASWTKIWLYILGRVNHKKNNVCERGEGFFQWHKEIGLLGTDITPDIIKKASRYFRRMKMIDTRRSTRGVYIKVLKYNTYQTFDSYTSTAPGTKKALEKHSDKQECKNEKNTSKETLPGLNDVITLFKDVNPTYESIYKNKTERRDLEWLINKFGRDKIEATIKHLPQIINRPYAPKITRPSELRRDLGKLIAFNNQEKGKLIAKNEPNYVL